MTFGGKNILACMGLSYIMQKCLALSMPIPEPVFVIAKKKKKKKKSPIFVSLGTKGLGLSYFEINRLGCRVVLSAALC